jgi:hypothetical protein
VVHLFEPREVYRYPRNVNTDTPLPPEEPAGKNPPDGAILYYHLKSSGAVTLEIADTNGTVVRRFSSDTQPPAEPANLNIPAYWIRPFQPLSGTSGMHRFVWDLHGEPRQGSGRGEYPISAVVHDTPGAQGEWMPPGVYLVKLNAAGQTLTQRLVVKPDPRDEVR